MFVKGDRARGDPKPCVVLEKVSEGMTSVVFVESIESELKCQRDTKRKFELASWGDD